MEPIRWAVRWLFLLVALRLPAQTRESIAQQMHSVARQRESLARQSALPAITAAATAAPPQDGGCDPIPEPELAPIIDSAAKAQRLPPKLLRAVIAQESAFRPCAVSRKGAQGLMQIMPAAALDAKLDDPFDPAANVGAGARFLRQLLERYGGDLSLSLAAYNAGPATVDQARAVPDIAETRSYVDAIVREMGIKQIDLPSIPTPKPIGN